MTPRIVSCALLLVASPVAGVPAADTSPPEAPRLVLVRQHPAPVLTTRSPGAEGIRYGFEGGRVVKVGGTYHLFTTEMAGDPMWVKTRFGHWTSVDRTTWKRAATVRESSGEFEGKVPGAGWLAVYDGETPDGIGWAHSADGVRWGKGQGLVLQPQAGTWSKEMRTPLGLVPEGDGLFTVFYTGFEQAPDWERILAEAGGPVTCAVGFAEVRLERPALVDPPPPHL
jgi:hypothetical protein